ncbi:hypothetical protein ACQPW1_29145 [Nocardia sp. CA-128927]|uniref:hypothetical protein n=1 Tax=Nocardia sp. CA-128927 TaxID=3239975 RepID=UPI003D99DA73
MSEEQKGTSEEKAGLKPSQVTAAALAAVTAAFLGSTLGVAGTVAGAGIASVVSTVGGELYLRSMRKTKEAAQRTKEMALARADSSTREQVGPVQQPWQVSGQRMVGYPPSAPHQAGRRNDVRPGAGAGYQTPWGQRHPTYHTAPGISAGRPVDGDPTVFIPRLNRESPVEGAGTGEEQARRRYSLRWPLIIGTSVVGFVIAILAITGFEGAIGKSISGDDVTTVGHIWSGGGGGQPEQPPTSGDNEPSQSRVPTTTTPQNGSDTEKRPTTSSSTPSTSVPKSSTPSTSVPRSTNTSRTPSSPPSNSNNAPGGGDQRHGSDGASEAPKPNVQ